MDFPEYLYVAIDEDGIYATDSPGDLTEAFGSPVRTGRYVWVGEGLTRADPHYVEFGDEVRGA
jgi:hypothetical protein